MAKLESPSAVPSIKPSKAELAPNEASSAGIAAVAISWPTSEKKLASPMPRMLRFNQPRPRAAGRASGKRFSFAGAGAVVQHFHLLHRDEASAHHFLEEREQRPHFFLRIDDLDDERKIGREPENFRGV